MIAYLILYRVIQASLMAGICTGQSITLLPYNQSNSKTKCTEGLISNHDKFVFYGEIRANITAVSIAKIDIHILKEDIADVNISDHDIFKHYVIDIKKGCLRDEKLACYCENTQDESLKRFIINDTALSRFSEKKIYCILSYGQHIFYSSKEQLPYISDGVGLLKVNNEEITNFTNHCYMELNVSQITIELYERLKPNRLKILSREGQDYLIVHQQFDQQGKKELNLEMSVCQKEIINVKCTIEFESENTRADSNKKVDVSAQELEWILTRNIAILLVPLYFFGIVAVVIWLIKNCCQKSKKDLGPDTPFENDDSESAEQTQGLNSPEATDDTAESSF